MDERKFKIDFENLPVYKHREKIVAALSSNQVVVVESNTGSGKTTQIPVILHEAGYTKEGKIIGMTQPRRIAAFSISEVVQEQLQFQYPELSKDFVQYKIRFEDMTKESTQVKIMTDGTLLQEIKHDHLLSAYSVLIIDEAHERSLNIDFILGLLKTICAQRQDLKVIISSATINSQKFADYFEDTCPIISIEAPMYDVQLRYMPIVKSNNSSHAKGKRRGRERVSFAKQGEILVQHVVDTVRESLSKKEGDILIFLAGEKPIKDCLEQVAGFPEADTLHLLPLYGRLDHATQAKVFDPAPEGKTKIIFATNIAETSITIDNITVVIDSGKVKLNFFHYQKLSSTLSETNISKASAIQRRGRAGRTRAGICYRLYSEEDFSQMPDFTEEEILRTDLSEIVLRMAHLGITDYENFSFVSPPPKNALSSGVAILQDMGALDKEKYITDIGRQMIRFPLSPAHARILVEAIRHYPDVLSNIIVILSFLTTQNPFLLPMNEELNARARHHKFLHKESDFFSYIKLFDSYRNTFFEEKPKFCEENYLDLRIMNEIVNIHMQLSEMVASEGVFVGTAMHEDQILKSVLHGFMHNVCIQLRGSTYLSRMGEKIYIHPGSMMFDLKTHPQIVVAGEIVQTSKVFARALTWCKLEWLKSDLPYMHKEISNVLSLVRNKSYASEQKLKAKMVTYQPLFSISAHSALNHIKYNRDDSISKKEKRDTSMNITLSGKSYSLSLRSDKKHKVLCLSWEEYTQMIQKISESDIHQFGNIRCDITYNPHVVLRNIKLVNLPIMYMLFGKKLQFSPSVPVAISIEYLKKTTHKAMLIDLLEHTMQILIPQQNEKKSKKHGHTRKHTSYEYKNEYQFLALGLNDNNELFLRPEGSFIQAIQDSLHTLGFLSDIAEEQNISLPKEAQTILWQVYKHIRNAYEKGIEIDHKDK